MKSRARTMIGLMVLLASAGAPAQKAGDTAAGVRAADAAWLKVFSAQDLDKSVAFFDEQGSMLVPNIPIATGKKAVAKEIATSFAYGSVVWHLNKAGVSRSGDLGYTNGTYIFTVKDPTAKPAIDRGKYLTVWKKQPDGSWKVLFDMFSSDQPP